MAYGFIQDVPANAEIYQLIKDKLGDSPPPGMIAHLVMAREGGLRYIDVWETEEAWNQFRDERVEPAVSEVLASFGIPHDHSMVVNEPFEVIDAWLGDRALR
jgi:hypothetical protein